MKRFLLVLGALAMLAAGGSICNKIAVINCEYDYIGVERAIDWLELEANLVSKIEIHNPNEIDVIIDQMEIDFYINDNDVGDGEPTFADTIPTGATDTLSFPIDVNFIDLGATLWDALIEGTVTFKIVGTIYFDTRVGEYDFPVTIAEGKLI